ncbi:MAG: MarR family transcriptional regulator [Methanobrevibacter sp.]|jgi:hypothetical protein|nr:MarR family transcriptional regulator [Candidatus Methanovirga procula]
MIKINLVKEFTGKELTLEFSKKYGSIERLERMFKRDPTNMEFYGDLDDWTYFNDHPDEKIEESKIIYTNKESIGAIELNLISLIKQFKPKSVSELAKLSERDLTTVQKKVKELEEEGFISLVKGSKNRKIPTLNYNKLEIAI